MLGPLLFLIYINDIQNESEHIDTILYADDTVLVQKTNSSFSNYQNDVKKVETWLNLNKLTLNIDKTYDVQFDRHKTVSSEKLTLNGNEATAKETVRYLGIEVDNHLNFKSHIELVISKLNKMGGLMYRLRKILKTSQLLAVYKAYIKPIIQYGVIVYGATSRSILKPLESKIKHISKIIFFKNDRGQQQLSVKNTLFLALKNYTFMNCSNFLQKH